MAYPKEAVVFEIVGPSENRSMSDLPIGTHVEGDGACCLERSGWKHPVMLIATPNELEGDQYVLVEDLRPLTQAAREMLAQFE